MNKIVKLLLLWVVAMVALPASAQQQRRISGTVSDDIDVIIGANVVERDKNNRIVSQAVTDMNGNFTMNIKDPNNVLVVSYIGYKNYTIKLGSKVRCCTFCVTNHSCNSGADWYNGCNSFHAYEE